MAGHILSLTGVSHPLLCLAETQRQAEERKSFLQWKGKGKGRLHIWPDWRLLAWRRWRQEDEQQGFLCDWLREHTWLYLIGPKGFPGGSEVKASACNIGDLGSIPGSGRSPGEGNGSPLQYSCLENPMDRGSWQATVHGVAKSWTQLSDFTSLHFIQHEGPLQKEMATYSSLVAWRIPWTEEPSGLQSMGFQTVR